LSLKAHPASFMRARLSARGILRSEALRSVKNGERVTVAGLVLVRQRPGTARGVIFMTLEDEAGIANIIVWPKVFERLRALVIGARFVAVTGKLQSESGVIHLIAERMEDWTPTLGQLCDEGRSISTLIPADEVKHPQLPVSKKRQGNRFAQVQLFGEARPEPLAPELKRALPTGRNFH
jgi:error-prone DNA polymerase